MNISLIKKVVEVEKNGVKKHYSNYYVQCGDVLVQVKPSFVDSQNYKMLDLIVELSKKGERTDD